MDDCLATRWQEQSHENLGVAVLFNAFLAETAATEMHASSFADSGTRIIRLVSLNPEFAQRDFVRERSELFCLSRMPRPTGDRESMRCLAELGRRGSAMDTYQPEEPPD